MFTVRPEDGPAGLDGFIARMKRDPGKITIAGASSTAEVLSKQIEGSGLNHLYIRYRESGKMMVDLIAGVVDAVLTPINGALPFMQQGKCAGIAISAPKRLANLPDTPTLMERLPGVMLWTWVGFFAPAKTPRPIVEALGRHFRDAFREPQLVKQIEQGGTPIDKTPEQVDAHIRDEAPRWAKIYADAGIKPE